MWLGFLEEVGGGGGGLHGVVRAIRDMSLNNNCTSSYTREW